VSNLKTAAEPEVEVKRELAALPNLDQQRTMPASRTERRAAGVTGTRAPLPIHVLKPTVHADRDEPVNNFSGDSVSVRIWNKEFLSDSFAS
jgi:hypothetical protein